ncbi:MAG TPA: DinB family protein [Candidatus Luteococcus avicola]|nr:DinB family protein [Candidatus Luteococcus avicola]
MAGSRPRATGSGRQKAIALGVRASREPGEGSYSLRWILVHLIEEYARHVGHLDLLRELVDGAIGD